MAEAQDNKDLGLGSLKEAGQGRVSLQWALLCSPVLQFPTASSCGSREGNGPLRISDLCPLPPRKQLTPTQTIPQPLNPSSSPQVPEGLYPDCNLLGNLLH